MIFRKHAHRIAVVLIMAILVTQFNVVSYGAETGSFGSEGSTEGDASVSEPVIRFTVPTRPADPEPEAPDYRTMFSTPSYTPIQLPIAIAEMKQPSKAGTEPAAVPESTPIPQSGQEQTSAPVENPQPQPIPAFTDPAVSVPAQTPTPAPGNTNVPPADEKESSKPEAETNRPDEDEGIPEGTTERIRELIRAGRLRAAEGSLSDNNAEKDTVSDDTIIFEDNGIVSLRADRAGSGIELLDGGAPVTIVIGGQSIRVEVSGADGLSLTWDTADHSIATVDSRGYITGHRQGPTTLIVTASNGARDTCELNVEPAKPKVIKLDVDSEVTLYLNKSGKDEETITATITPSYVEGDYRKLDWTCSDLTKVSISPNGEECTIKAKALTDGVTVTATSRWNPSATANCTVKVLPWVEVTGVTVRQPEGRTWIYEGESIDLTASVSPGNASEQDVTWEIVEAGKASVTDRGKDNGVPTATVTNPKAGTITVKATSTSNPSVSGTYSLTVKPVPVSNMTLTASPNPMKIVKGKTGTITVRLSSDTGYTPTNKNVIWVSSDPGKVRLSTGTTNATPKSVTVYGDEITDSPVTITATSQDGSYTKTIEVTVVEPTAVTSFNVTPEEVEVQIGDTTTGGSFEAKILPAEATNQTVKWQIVDGGNIARISGASNGTYTGKTCKVFAAGTLSGNATIRATLVDGTKIYSIDGSIKVIPRKVQSISLSPTVINMDEAVPSTLTKQLTATISPSNAANKKIIWTVEDESIVSLAETGTVTGSTEKRTVTGLKPGSTTVTVTTEDGGFSKTCTINIKRKPIALTGLTIDPTSAKIKKGSSFPLHWELVPADADCESVTLSGYDPEMITVEKTGDNDATVSGANVGNTQITVTAKNGSSIYTQTCSVTVEWINVTSVALSCDEIFMVEGETRQLDASVYPSDAEDTSVSWNSAAPSIAGVDQTGLVTAVSEGTTVVTVVSNDGGHKAVCAVHVRRPGTDVDGITVTPSENTVNIGEVFTAEAIVTPDEATDKTVKWKSNNPAVASVSSNGLTADITAKAVGSAVISATASNGMTAFCIVNVEKGIVHVREVLIPMYETIYTGQSASLPATVKPDDADDKTLIWTSSDEDTVSVNSAGRIFGKKEGQATIKATAADGGAYSECLVTVEDLPKPAPEKYTVIPVDKRPGAYLPELEIAAVESLEGDRYLVIFDSDGAAIKRRIRGDTSLSYTRAIFCDMLLVDEYANPKDDFIRCTVRIPLPPEMDIHKGTVRVVSLQGENLDKSIPSSVGEYDGVAYVTFTTTHFSEYAILYKENKKEDPKVVTKIEYRDKPVVQYVKEPEKKSQTEVKPAASQPAPAPVVITRILDNIPKTGDISQ